MSSLRASHANFYRPQSGLICLLYGVPQNIRKIVSSVFDCHKHSARIFLTPNSMLNSLPQSWHRKAVVLFFFEQNLYNLADANKGMIPPPMLLWLNLLISRATGKVVEFYSVPAQVSTERRHVFRRVSGIRFNGPKFDMTSAPSGIPFSDVAENHRGYPMRRKEIFFNPGPNHQVPVSAIIKEVGFRALLPFVRIHRFNQQPPSDSRLPSQFKLAVSATIKVVEFYSVPAGESHHRAQSWLLVSLDCNGMPDAKVTRAGLLEESRVTHNLGKVPSFVSSPGEFRRALYEFRGVCNFDFFVGCGGTKSSRRIVTAHQNPLIDHSQV
ncbi:hypothetical protein C8R43DRAFT_951693 [Mycena crocata]|nr:hypothetical protein C8R43DRAFT_951693 [Mycena crocata]